MSSFFPSNSVGKDYYYKEEAVDQNSYYLQSIGEYSTQIPEVQSYYYPSRQPLPYDSSSEELYGSTAAHSYEDPQQYPGSQGYFGRKKYSKSTFSSYGGVPETYGYPADLSQQYLPARSTYSRHSQINIESSYPRSSYNHGTVQSLAVHSRSAYSPTSTFSDELPEKAPQRRNNFSPNNSVAPPKQQNAKQRGVSAPDGFIYQVQFKRAHKNFILAPSAPRDLLPGDFVKVEADRGEDMGIVLAKCPAETFEEVIPTAGFRGRGFSSGQGERKYLFRRATPEERTALATKVADEEKALEYIREKVAERGYPMSVLDAEYQFDRHKLTFFFEADKRIDFRDLVSELFSLYKTRIWMQQVDTSTISPHDAGLELARATGFLPTDIKEDVISTRSSFATSNEDPLSGGSINNDFGELETPQAAEAAEFSPQKLPNHANALNDITECYYHLNLTESWYASNY